MKPAREMRRVRGRHRVDQALNLVAAEGVDMKRLAAAQEDRALPAEEARAILRRHEMEMLPRDWECLSITDDGAAYRNDRTGQTVIVSVSRETDGRRWLHVSTAFPDRLPTYAELARVKRLWIGEGRRALQLFVESGAHVNIHRYALHLWHCVDGDGLPDFSRGTGSV